MRTVDHPPLAVVRAIVGELASRGMTVAVGGSAVLAARGLIDRVRDWDVTVDAEPETVITALTELDLTFTDETTSEPPFATVRRLVVDAGDHSIDVLVGFALRKGPAAVPIPVRVASHWLDLPIAHPEDWALAYDLLGRSERARALRHSASSDASDWMGR